MRVYNTVYFDGDAKVLSSVVARSEAEARLIMALRKVGEELDQKGKQQEGAFVGEHDFTGEFMPPDLDMVLSQARFMARLSRNCCPDKPIEHHLAALEGTVERLEGGKRGGAQSPLVADVLWDTIYRALVALRMGVPGVSTSFAKGETPRFETTYDSDGPDSLLNAVDGEEDQTVAYMILSWIDGLQCMMGGGAISRLFGYRDITYRPEQMSAPMLEIVTLLRDATEKCSSLSLQAQVSLLCSTLSLKDHPDRVILRDTVHKHLVDTGADEEAIKSYIGGL